MKVSVNIKQELSSRVETHQFRRHIIKESFENTKIMIIFCSFSLIIGQIIRPDNQARLWQKVSDYITQKLPRRIETHQLWRLHWKTKSLGAHKKNCAPSDRKRLTVMIRKLDSNGSITCHNRLTTFLMQLIRSLETSDFFLFSNDIDHLVQVFGFRVIDFVFQCRYQRTL
jgi:hypothetical protein